MAVIKTLDVFLRGNTQSLDAALDKSGKKVGKFQNQVATPPKGVGQLGSSLTGAFDSLASSIPGGSAIAGMFSGIITGAQGAKSALGMLGGAFLGLTAAGVAAGVGLAKMGLDAMNTVGATAKMAKLLGLSTQSLQVFEYQAKMSGISSEDLYHNLLKMAEGFGDSTSKQSKALRELGINDAAFADMKTVDQMQAISQAMQKVTNQSDRLRLSKELHGRAGAEMAAFWEKDISTMRQAAEATGNVVSDDKVSQIRDANLSWKEMNASIDGLSKSMATELAPAVKSVADSLKALFKDSNDLFAESTTKTADWVNFLKAAPGLIALGFTAMFNSIEHGFMVFLPQVYISFGKMTAGIFHDIWMNAVNDFRNIFFGEQNPWIELGKNIETAMDEIGEAFKRPFTDLESELAEATERLLNPKLTPERRAAMEGYTRGIVGPEGVKGAGAGGGNYKEPDKGTSKIETSTPPKAALAGSQDAFQIIAQDQGNKMFKVANDQLKEQVKASKYLDTLIKVFKTGDNKLLRAKL